MKQKSLIKNSIFNIIYTVANVLFPFLTSIYVSRILLPSGVGVVAYAQNIASYFITFAALGLPSYGVREFAKVRNNSVEKNKLFSELFVINMFSTTISVVGYIFIVVLNNGFGNEWSLYGACGLTIVFNYLNIDWLYQGEEEYGYIVGRSLTMKTCSLLALVCLVKNREDYVFYALINSFAVGGNYLFNIWHAKSFVHFDRTNLNLKKHIKPIVLIAVVVFLTSVYSKIDTTMLGIMVTTDAVGQYAYAQKTILMALTMCTAITAALLPRLSCYYEDNREAFNDLLNKGFAVLCFCAIPLCVGLIILAPQVVDVIYGSEFKPAGVAIRLLCPILLIKGFGDLFCYQLVYSTKSEKILVPATIFAAIINIILNAILIPVFQQNGAVVASVISELIANVIQYIYIRHKIKIHLESKPLWIALFSTVLMGMLVIMITRSGLSNITTLFVGVVTGGSFYVLMNIVCKNEILLRILHNIESRIKEKVK